MIVRILLLACVAVFAVTAEAHGVGDIEQEQDWFEVYRIEDGIFAIYEPGQFEEVISFLVTGDDRALLFDTGLGIGDIKRVVKQLTDLESHRRQLPVRNDLRS
jgi:hypothetical protein